MLFAVQTTIVPGDSLGQKFDQLARWGYDGIEVSGADLLERAGEVRRLITDTGLPVTSACGGYFGWLVDRNPRARGLAIAQIQRILATGAELGIPGLVVPAAYGIGARAGLPPARYAFSVEEDRALLVDGLEQVLASAERTGGTLYLEPLNRYEDRVLNTLAEARAIIETLASPHLKLMPDFFHMNIEEANLPASLREHAAVIGHLHLADSNRQLPGQGHTDWVGAFAALRDAGYAGALAIECKPPADPQTDFPAALRFLRSLKNTP